VPGAFPGALPGGTPGFVPDRNLADQFQLNTDPSRILNNPFFQALANQQRQATINSRAAAGLGGSGGTQDAIARNLLLLGSGFQQQDIANQFGEFGSQLTQNQQRFGQLFDITRLGAGAAGQQAAAQSGIQQNLANVGAASTISENNVISNLVTQLAGLFSAGINTGGTAGSSTIFPGVDLIPAGNL